MLFPDSFLFMIPHGCRGFYLNSKVQKGTILMHKLIGLFDVINHIPI